VDIHGDEFLGFLRSDRRNRVQKVDEFLGLISCCIVKIQSILHFLNVDCVFVCAVLENELFEVEESSLVGDLLADLDASSPCVCSV